MPPPHWLTCSALRNHTHLREARKIKIAPILPLWDKWKLPPSLPSLCLQNRKKWKIFSPEKITLSRQFDFCRPPPHPLHRFFFYSIGQNLFDRVICPVTRVKTQVFRSSNFWKILKSSNQTRVIFFESSNYDRVKILIE